MLKNMTAPARAKPYSVSRTITPVHAIDATWNQSLQAIEPQPDASGMINGYPAETYYSIGPALISF
jgi:hypothetical protein